MEGVLLHLVSYDITAEDLCLYDILLVFECGGYGSKRHGSREGHIQIVHRQHDAALSASVKRIRDGGTCTLQSVMDLHFSSA